MPISEPQSHNRYPVHSLNKGLELLLLFKSPEQALRLSEAARILKIAPSTVHRLLATLISLGFVRQDLKTRAYFAGATLLDQAHSLVGEGVLRRVATAEMERLVQRTHETAVLAVLRGSEAHFIASFQSRNLAQVNALPPRLGSPAYATACGKMLLAQLTRSELRKLYGSPHLAMVTSRTIARRSALERELADVRTRGYAVSHEENRAGVHGMATLIRAPHGGVYGSLGLLLPSPRLPPGRIASLARDLQSAANRVAARLQLIDDLITPELPRKY